MDSPATNLAADEAAPLVFRLRGENLHYGGTAVLTRVSLSIRRGDKIALIGKSGVGKTTLLKHLRGMAPRDCAWCPQAPGLVPMLSVYHNIYMGGLERYGAASNLLNLLRPRPRARAEIEGLCETLDLGEHLWRSVDQLSGGQQQRVAVGRAMYQRKPVLLADEPVFALDGHQGENLLSILLSSHRTAVIGLHDVDLAKTVCNRVIGLRDGGIHIDCAASALTADQLADLYR